MPVTPLVAEEIADVVPASASVSVDVVEVPEVVLPLVPEVVSDVAVTETEVAPDQVCDTSTSTSVVDEAEVASSSPIVSSPDVTSTEPMVVIVDTPIVAELSLQADTQEDNFTTLGEGSIVVTGETSLSEEDNFETLTGIPSVVEQGISGENSFITSDQIIDNSAVISNEGSFNTLSTPADRQTVSRENSFVTQASVPVGPAVSVENSFSTLPGGPITIDPVVSPENHFTTLSLPDKPLAVSEENSFTTLNTSGGPDGEENSFTTLSNGGCTSNCGGGGGGGSSSSSSSRIVLAEKTYSCPVYLHKFIKFGEANDRREVIKLQAFLKVYEGFSNLKITGVYDRATFEAVEIFQSRYLRDILKPWQINDPTGFVYITTRQAINNIYCGRDTKNDLLFRKRVAYEYYLATGEDIDVPVTEPTDGGYFIVPTSTATTTSVLKPNVFLAGVGELLDFIGENFCWLLNLLLLLLIFFLLWLLWQKDRDDDELEGPNSHETEDFDTLLPEDEEELAKLAEEDESKMDVLDNNPWQEAIALGPETTEEE